MGKKSHPESEPSKKRKFSEESSNFIPFSTNTIEVIVSGFPDSTPEDRIKKLFKSCGDFSLTVPAGSQGVVFLKFSSHKYASKALELNGGSYKGRTLLINLTSDLPLVKREKPIVTPVFVGNLKEGTTVDQLRSFFSGAGTIKAIRISAEKGFAHVDFTSRYSAMMAEKLAGGKLNGKRVKIEIADSKKG